MNKYKCFHSQKDEKELCKPDCSIFYHHDDDIFQIMYYYYVIMLLLSLDIELLNLYIQYIITCHEFLLCSKSCIFREKEQNIYKV